MSDTTLSTKILLKRGSGAPPANTLAAGELGIDITNNELYLGEDSELVTSKYYVRNYNALQITSQPEDCSIDTSSSSTDDRRAQFSVVAEGDGDLSYQWQYMRVQETEWSDSSIASARTANYSTVISQGSTALNKCKYRCRVTDGYGVQVYSNYAVLTITNATDA